MGALVKALNWLFGKKYFWNLLEEDMLKTQTAMQTTKSSSLSAASLLAPTSWTARTNIKMVGMVDILRLGELSSARILQVEAAKNSRFNISREDVKNVARIINSTR